MRGEPTRTHSARAQPARTHRGCWRSSRRPIRAKPALRERLAESGCASCTAPERATTTQVQGLTGLHSGLPAL